jgi:hypothetical protein
MPKKGKRLTRILYYPRKNYRHAIQILKLLAEKEILPTQTIASMVKSANNHHGTKLQMEYLTSLGYCEDYVMISNSDHSCDNCKKSYEYLLGTTNLEHALRTLEESQKLKEEKKNNPDFDPKDYHVFKKNHILGRLVSVFTCKECKKTVRAHLNEQYKIGSSILWTLSDNGKFLFLVLYKMGNDNWLNFIKKNLNKEIFELIYALYQSQEKDTIVSLIKKLKYEMPDTAKLSKIVSLWYDEMFSEIMNTTYKDELHKPLTDFQKNHYMEYATKRIMESRGKRFK